MKFLIPVFGHESSFYQVAFSGLLNSLVIHQPRDFTVVRHCENFENVKEALIEDGAFKWFDGGLQDHLINNLIKTQMQCAMFDQEVADGEVACFIDSDTFIVNPITEIESMDFDIAYTVRDLPHGSVYCPFNCGVMFWRKSGLTKAANQIIKRTVEIMAFDKDFHEEWSQKYYGIQQAAFGYFLDTLPEIEEKFKMLRLPCNIWNCEDSSWHQFDRRKTKIAHVKGAMRICCENGIVPVYEGMREIYNLFEMYSTMDLFSGVKND